MLKKIKEFIKSDKKIQIYLKGGFVFTVVLLIIMISSILYLGNNVFLLNDNQIMIYIGLSTVLPFLIGVIYTLYKLNKEKLINFKETIKNVNYKVIILSLTIIILLGQIIGSFGGGSSYNIVSEMFHNTILGYIILLFTVSLMGFLEELYFRGAIFDILIKIGNKFTKNKKRVILFTIIITGFLFGIAHSAQYGFILIIQVFFIGIVLGYVRYKYGIINSILIHIGNNVLTFLLFVGMILLGFTNNTVDNSKNNEFNILVRYYAHIYNTNPYFIKYNGLMGKLKGDNIKKMTKEEKEKMIKKLKKILQEHKEGKDFNLVEFKYYLNSNINYLKGNI